MLGREHEREAVQELARAAARGRGGVILVEGELGTGKSLLLSHAASAASTAGVSVAAACADELSRFMPLGLLLQTLGESSAGLADEAGPSGPALQLFWLIESVRARLEKRAAVGPLLVSLDDLQWADPATLEALRIVPTQLASYPLAWILARRSPSPDSDNAGLLFDVLEGEGAARIVLPPLGRDDAAELLTQVLGATPDAGVLGLAAGAVGNPLLLAELAQGLLEEDAVVVTGGRACLRSAHVPKRIQAAVRERLDRLGPATRQLMETAAVLGRAFSLEDAAAMLDTSPALLLPAVDEALAAGVLAASADALAFRHELVWRAVLDAMPSPVRRALHRQIGELLLARGSAASAAAHLLSQADGGDRAALAGLDRAANEALPSSPPIAADLAARSLELTPPGDPELIRRSVAAAEALTAAGRLDEATALASSALAMPLPADVAARLRCARSTALWLSGQAAEALTEAERVLAEPHLPDGLRADAKLALVQGLTGLRDHGKAGRLAESVLAAPGTESQDVVTAALVAQAVISWDGGRLTEALDLSSEAVRTATGMRPGARQCHPHLFLASRLVDLRRFDEARSVMRAAVDQPGPLDLPGWSATPATLRARMALALGWLDDATAEAQADLSMASVLGSHLRGSGAPAVLATVALHRGDLNAAAEHMERSAAQRSRFGAAYADTWGTVVAAQVAEARDGPAAALRLLEGVYAEIGRQAFLLMCDPACAAWLVRAALAAGDQDRARAAATAASAVARASPEFDVAATAAAHAAGLASRDPARLAQAAARHRDPWARASAGEDLGKVLAAAGARRKAIARFEHAIEEYEATGATRDLARVRKRLRTLGIRRRHWATQTRPATGWPSLTSTEGAVSELVSQGCTNQQVADQMFISVHTVAFHLRQIFRKLGISSRVELARITVGQGRATR